MSVGVIASFSRYSTIRLFPSDSNFHLETHQPMLRDPFPKSLLPHLPAYSAISFPAEHLCATHPSLPHPINYPKLTVNLLNNVQPDRSSEHRREGNRAGALSLSGPDGEGGSSSHFVDKDLMDRKDIGFLAQGREV
jgi:hypothetical protein